MRRRKHILSHRVYAFTLSALLYFPALSAQEYPAHSPLYTGTVYRIAVDHSAVYRVGPSDIPSLEGLSVNNVALLGCNGAMISETNGTGMAHPLLNLPIQIHDNNSNGIIDSDDYLMFYGEGVDRWVETGSNYRYVRHAYATANNYFVVLGKAGRTVTQFTPTSAVADSVTTHTVVATHHIDQNNIFETGQVWVGERFSSTQTSRTISLTLPSSLSSTQANVRVAVANDGEGDANFTFTMNGQSANCQVSRNAIYRSFELTFPTHTSATYSMQCNYTPSSGTSVAYLDYIELTGLAPMQYRGEQILLRSRSSLPAAAVAPVCYGIANAGAELIAWDITQPDSCYAMSIHPDRSQGWITVCDGSERQVILFDPSRLDTPLRIEAVNAPDIAGASLPDMVIVCPPEFAEQAERLAALHRSYDGLHVMVVTPQSVYDEFSAGKQDPLAYREMLRSYYKRYSGQAPRYLLMFGHGNYDPRNIMGDHGITLVTCEAYASFGENGNTYASDDLMGYLEDNETSSPSSTLEVGIGRLPAKSESEARHLVDKIEGYITHRDLKHNDVRGDWRNAIVLLADDADPGSRYDTLFAHDAEKLATQIKIHHPQYNITRVFADAFAQQSGSSGSFYPDVNNALKQRIDYGCLLLNYIGHGSTHYIGTERYISPNEIEAYNNIDRLCFFVTSTCTFGRFDMPNDICGAEQFMLADGGGIGLITATRPIVHHEAFNTSACCELLNSANSIGDAWRIAKNRNAVSHSIVLIGDPALHLSIPDHQVAVTAINSHPVVEGINDTATVLSEVIVSGHIVDINGLEDDSFNGPLYITVYDRESVSRTQANDNEGCEVSFKQQKDILFRGNDSIRNGQFEYRFTVPMDVAYDYAACKLSHYAHDTLMDATGAYTNLFIGGFDTTRTIDDSYPEVQLYLNDTTFRSGGSCDENPTLYAVLRDSVGINSVGSGLGHDITATLDGNGNTLIALNDFYRTDDRDSRGGTVTYQFTNLTEGWHTLTLKAWNIFNRSGCATIRFFVQSSDHPGVTAFMTSPNPTSDHSSIRIEHNCPGHLSHIVVDIYDMRGRLIRQWKPESDNNSYVVGPIEWLCDDSGGHPVKSGIYTARVRYRVDGNDHTEYTKIIVQR